MIAWFHRQDIPSHFANCSRLIGSSLGGLSWTGVFGANLPLDELVSVDISGCVDAQFHWSRMLMSDVG